MKSAKHLFEQIVSFENLVRAAHRSARGRRSQPEVYASHAELEENLIGLQGSLQEGRWEPAGYRDFWVREPKRRRISAAPYADRVVHHAICAVLEPVFERRFIAHSFACRPGKGVHAAVDEYQRYCGEAQYVLKCDVREYFASIDHTRLLAVIRRSVGDVRAMELIERVVRSNDTRREAAPGRGLPIGNLTSQLFANVFLDRLDHVVKDEMGVRRYIRYMDDFVLLGDEKREMWSWLDQVGDTLQDMGLRLHPAKVRLSPTSEGCDFLGHRLLPEYRRLRAATGYRARRRLLWTTSRLARGEVSWDRWRSSVMAWLGHARHADATGLTVAMLREIDHRFGLVRFGRTACFEAAPGTTTTTTSGPPTATTTTRTTATTTSGSAWPAQASSMPGPASQTMESRRACERRPRDESSAPLVLRGAEYDQGRATASSRSWRKWWPARPILRTRMFAKAFSSCFAALLGCGLAFAQTSTAESNVFTIGDPFQRGGVATGESGLFTYGIPYTLGGIATLESNQFDVQNAHVTQATGRSGSFAIGTTGGNGGSPGDSAWNNFGLAATQNPIVLVNGISPLSLDPILARIFDAPRLGHNQWDGFLANFLSQHPEYKRHGQPGSESRTTVVFVCNTLDTSLGAHTNAARLNEYLQNISTTFAMRNAQTFTIVGYSYGGLIARCWEVLYDNPLARGDLQYNILNKRVSSIISMNTPHRGTPTADFLFMLALARLAAWPDTVLNELTTSYAGYSFPGWSGTIYSRIGSSVEWWLPLFGSGDHDAIVPLSSQLDGSWMNGTARGIELFAGRFSHSGPILGLGFPDVREQPITARLVWTAMRYADRFGPSPGLARATGPDLRSSLAESATIEPMAVLRRTVPVPRSARVATFGAEFLLGGGAFTLLDPMGREVVKGPGVEFGTLATSPAVRITKPMPGEYTLLVKRAPGAEDGAVAFTAFDDASYAAEVTAPPVARPGQPVRAIARIPMAGHGLPGGGVWARLLGPSVQDVRFYDDGAHADGLVGDGVYGSELILPASPGKYVLSGRVVGAQPEDGWVSRTFSVPLVASTGAAQLGDLASEQPVEDPGDDDTLYDLLDVGVRVTFARAGRFVLSGELWDRRGMRVDSDARILDVTGAGTEVHALRFKGQVIGENAEDGPFDVRNVKLEELVPSGADICDFVSHLGQTQAYKWVDFESITARTVAPPEAFSFGLNLVSFPLEPSEKVDLAALFGPRAKFLTPGWPAKPPIRGKAFYVQVWDLPASRTMYAGEPGEGPFVIRLGAAGKNTLGCPFDRAIPLASLQVRNPATGVTRTATQDANSPDAWVQWDFRYRLGGAWRNSRLAGGQDDSLRPWFGYELTTNIANVEVIVTP